MIRRIIKGIFEDIFKDDIKGRDNNGRICPNDDSPLIKKVISDIEFELCEKCGGCWFDKGASISSLIDLNIDEGAIDSGKTTFEDEEDTLHNTKHCLKCHLLLDMSHRTFENNMAEMYTCEKCNGVWLDAGYYQNIKDIRKRQEWIQAERTRKAKEFHGFADPLHDNFSDTFWIFTPNIPAPMMYASPRERERILQERKK